MSESGATGHFYAIFGSEPRVTSEALREVDDGFTLCIRHAVTLGAGVSGIGMSVTEHTFGCSQLKMWHHLWHLCTSSYVP